MFLIKTGWWIVPLRYTVRLFTSTATVMIALLLNG